MPLLEVNELRTEFATRQGALPAVDGVSLSLERGEILGLVGESGSGKSVTGFSIMGLIDEPGRIASGSVLFEGKELVGANEESLRQLRGHRIAMIFQDPMLTLNPVLRVDTQMVETMLAHESISKQAARDRCREVLSLVGIASPDERLQQYPHQFSGGMRQRVAIAIALLHRPSLIIADEPTTALDVTVQGQILFEMQKLVRETKSALIWITHDLAVIAGLADRIAVMYAGKIVELGTGLCFLTGRFISLANLVLLPITVNILLIHIFLSPELLPIGGFLFGANIYFIYSKWSSYQSVLTIR